MVSYIIFGCTKVKRKEWLIKMRTYDDECLAYFLEHQEQLLPERIAETMEEAETIVNDINEKTAKEDIDLQLTINKVVTENAEEINSFLCFFEEFSHLIFRFLLLFTCSRLTRIFFGIDRTVIKQDFIMIFRFSSEFYLDKTERIWYHYL